MASIKDKAKNLVQFAKYTHDNELDNVVKEIVNLVQEQRLEVLEELITKLKLNNYETIVKKRQGQKVTEFSKRETI